ncbi:hypothetical protein V8F20_009434 [Naviculisporaceae sp. PSN 640]
MVLKRKRSEPEFYSSSAFSTPQRLSPDKTFDFEASTRGFFTPPAQSSSRSYFVGRTMKRFRDNRPPQEEIHQRTLNLLYSAQQQHAQVQSLTPQSPSEPAAMAPTVSNSNGHAHRSSQQRSLHSFWNIPSAPVPVIVETAPSPRLSRSILGTSNSCEDCGAGLGGGDGDEVMMGVDSYGLEGGDRSCRACGKIVCFSCSVSNLGEDRRCLICAGRRTGVDGMVWKAPAVGIC